MGTALALETDSVARHAADAVAAGMGYWEEQVERALALETHSVARHAADAVAVDAVDAVAADAVAADAVAAMDPAPWEVVQIVQIPFLWPWEKEWVAIRYLATHPPCSDPIPHYSFSSLFVFSLETCGGLTWEWM